MKRLLAGVTATAGALAAWAQDAPQPALHAGDTWTYLDTTERGQTGWAQVRDEFTVTRVSPSSIYFTSRQAGSTQAPKDLFCGLDWSRVRTIDGKETVVNRPLDFPLAKGRTWSVSYTEQHPNKAHRYEQWETRYTVVGTETVEVPAGRFEAIKIEAEGTWKAELAPSSTVVQGAQTIGPDTSMSTDVRKTVAAPVGGRTYKALWYAPGVKRWVKSVEEYYGPGGARNERYSAELESFKLAE